MPQESPRSPSGILDDEPLSLVFPHSSPSDYESRASDTPSQRNKRPRGLVLEPPIAATERSSSPRNHAVSSPPAARTASTSTSGTPSHPRGITAASSSSRPRPTWSTPQPPSVWPADDISLPSIHDDQTLAAAGWLPNDINGFYSSEDHFLSDLANNEYSSPSTYPSLSSRQLPRTHPQQRLSAHSPPSATTQALDPRILDNTSQRETQNSASTSFATAVSNFSEDLGVLDHIDTSQTSFTSDDMPPTTRRLSASRGADVDTPRSSASERRRRTSTAAKQAILHTSTRSPKRFKADDDNPFLDIDEEGPVTTNKANDLFMIDLTNPKEPPKEPSVPAVEPPKNENFTKLSAFQCAICMDDVTALTVTHCGHMYCAQCLHTSLHVESQRGKCPMCRSKLDMKERDAYTSKTKGYYRLELKLMTRTKQGKRKAEVIS